MKESLEKKLMEQYPAYHEQPLSLSIAEINDPRSVLSYFFTSYDLPDMRACLKEFLHDALRSDNSNASSHVSLHQDLEKLVEASWLIYQQKEVIIETKNTVSEIPQKPDLVFSGTKELDSKYQKIHEFFESFTLPFARDYLLSAFKAAESTQIWNKAVPNDLLYYFESIEALLPAIYSIVKEGNKIKQVVLPKSVNTPDLTQGHLYCGQYDQHKPWDYFPRSLSTKEFHDPYKALQKFTSWAPKKDWKLTLHYLLSYALGANSLSELGVNLEMVRISELLLKMLEACHLIYVRTSVRNTHSDPEK